MRNGIGSQCSSWRADITCHMVEGPSPTGQLHSALVAKGQWLTTKDRSGWSCSSLDDSGWTPTRVAASHCGRHSVSAVSAGEDDKNVLTSLLTCGFVVSSLSNSTPRSRTTLAGGTTLPAPYALLEFARLARVRSISGWAARWMRTLLLLPPWALGTETRRWPILHWTTYGVRESYLDDRLLHILLLQYLYLKP